MQPERVDMKTLTDELWVRRWLAKTAFMFGLGLGFLLGFIVTMRLFHQ